MTTTHRAPRIRTILAVFAATALLASCGGKDAAAEPPASSGSSSSDSSAASPSPSVEPASGGLMDTATASLHAPQGWDVTTLVKDQTVSGLTGNGLSAVALSVVDNYGEDYTLEQLARLDIRTGSYTRGRVMPETELAGEPAFHVHGKATVATTYDAYGLEHDGHTVTVVFKLHSSTKDPQQVIDSVLATLELK